MKPNYLLPNHFKKIGWILFIPGIILGVFYLFDEIYFNFLDLKILSIASQHLAGTTELFSITKNNFTDELIGLLLIMGSLLIAFSKEKSEDEFISKIRLESLVWATYFNYAILIITIIFIFDTLFFWVLVFNMFTILIFFIIRFNWALYKTKNQLKDEE